MTLTLRDSLIFFTCTDKELFMYIMQYRNVVLVIVVASTSRFVHDSLPDEFYVTIARRIPAVSLIFVALCNISHSDDNQWKRETRQW